MYILFQCKQVTMKETKEHYAEAELKIKSGSQCCQTHSDPATRVTQIHMHNPDSNAASCTTQI